MRLNLGNLGPLNRLRDVTINELEIFDFYHWCDTKKNRNILKHLPFECLFNLAKEYLSKEDKDVSLFEITDFTNKVNTEINSIFEKQKFSIQFRRKHQREKKQLKFLDRVQEYGEVDFHATFLHPLGDAKSFKKFLANYWIDIDELTDKYINFYYDRDGIDHSGFKYLKDFSKLRTLDILLPSIVIWQNSKENTALSISLKGIAENDMLELIQKIVFQIKNNSSLITINDSLKSNYKTNIHTKSNKPLRELYFENKLPQQEYQERSQLNRFYSWVGFFKNKNNNTLLKDISTNNPEKVIDSIIKNANDFLNEEPLLLETVKTVVEEYIQEIVLIQSRISILNKEIMAGIISYENKTLALNRINLDLLKFIRRI